MCIDETIPRSSTGYAAAQSTARLRAQLAEHPLLAKIPSHERAMVVERFGLREVAASSVLVRQGEPSDGLFIVLTGRGRVVVERDDESLTVGELGPGDVIGEMSLLAGVPRSATVTAVRDCVVAFLPRCELDELMDRVPALWRELGRFAARRSMTHGDEGRAAMTLAMIPMHAGLDLRELAEHFSEALQPFGSTITLDDSATTDRDGLDLVPMLGELERRHRFVLYVANPTLDSWTRRCLRQADRVVLVADSHRSAAPSAFERSLTTVPGTSEAPRHLLLRQPPSIRVASGTAAWLEPRELVSHHHVRRGNVADAARAARLLTGRGFGVAFSGAAAKGVGHVGVVAACHRLGIPIDTVSGTSAGAPVSVGYARGDDISTLIADYGKFLRGLRPTWHSYTLPMVSLLNGRDARAVTRDVMGDVLLEDLLIPCTLTATDLSRSRLHAFRTGEAWLAARASASVPGLWPPVAIGDSVYVDGALMKSVPVDELMPQCRHGLLVASDFGRATNEQQSVFRNVQRYGDVLSGWKVLWDRLGRSSVGRSYPTVSRVMTHVALIHCNQEYRRLADGGSRFVHLQPDVPVSGMFGGSAEAGRMLAHKVERYAHEQLLPHCKSSPWAVVTLRGGQRKLGADGCRGRRSEATSGGAPEARQAAYLHDQAQAKDPRGGGAAGGYGHHGFDGL